MKIKRLIPALLLTFALVPAAYAQTTGGGGSNPPAQSTISAGSISLNTPVIVTLSGSDPVTLDYKASTGQTVSITARSLEADGVIDPILSIIDANGEVVEDNDDHRTSRTDLAPRDSLIADFTFTNNGRYTIQVVPFEAAEGDVEVLISDGSVSPGTDIQEDVPETPAGNDVVVEDEVPDGETFSYDFDASEGAVVTITVRETDGQLDPKVVLLDSDGAQLAENDDHSSNDANLGPYDSQITEFTVTASGTYTVAVTGFGGVGGSFELTIAFGGSGSQQNTNPPNNNSSGDTEVVEDTIESFDVYTHTFEAEAGDVYTFTVQALSDDLDPTLSLYFDNRYLLDNDDYGSTDSDLQGTDSRIYHYIIQESGEYELDIGGYQDSSGDFRLTLERVATGAPVGAPDEQIELGTVNAGRTYSYSFEAEAGDYVTISVRGLSYQFDAYVALLDENGTVLLNNDDHGGGSAELAFYDAQIPNYIIEASGTYTVEVSNLADGNGTFGLTVGILR